jgi:tetratricopeptide (TPR) repeat protein
MKLLLSISVVVLLFVPSALYAETKEIISEGTYNMGDGETPSVAESRALRKAKQIAVEQAGTYVESYSKVKNITLTHDEIQVLASGLMEVEILDKKRTVVGDGINFWVKIKAKVNPDKMEEMAKRLKDKSALEDYKRIQEAYANSQKEIEGLKKELAKSKDGKEKKYLESKIADDEKLFEAYAWFEKGSMHGDKGEYDDAIGAYTRALSLNPAFSWAYNNRGVVYADKKMYDKAIKDYSRALSLNQSRAEVYNNRGVAYSGIEQYDKAIEDFDKALALNPYSALIYSNRGRAYIGKHQYDKAIRDGSKAIELDPNLAQAYVFRGMAYLLRAGYEERQVDFDHAVTDIRKACNMGDIHACSFL